MINLFRLGPLDVGGQRAYAYFGLDGDGALIPMVVVRLRDVTDGGE